MTQKADTLFINAIVLTMDEKLNQYDPGAVAVKGDAIVAVGLEENLKKEYSANEVIDCGGKVLMPGWSMRTPTSR
jgi:5-methylthioadenosine/S-adenosylhomocysteine deaminase